MRLATLYSHVLGHVPHPCQRGHMFSPPFSETHLHSVALCMHLIVYHAVRLSEATTDIQGNAKACFVECFAENHMLCLLFAVQMMRMNNVCKHGGFLCKRL